MKRQQLIAFLLLSLATGIFTWGSYAHAQQPKPDSKPIALSAEASVQWIDAQRQINDLQKSITILQQQQLILAAKAQVPDTYQVIGLDAEKRVVYAPPPKPADTAQAKPKE